MQSDSWTVSGENRVSLHKIMTLNDAAEAAQSFIVTQMYKSRLPQAVWTGYSECHKGSGYGTGRETHVNGMDAFSRPWRHCEAEGDHPERPHKVLMKDLLFCDAIVLESMEKMVRNVFNDLGLPAGRSFARSNQMFRQTWLEQHCAAQVYSLSGPRSQRSRRPSGNYAAASAAVALANQRIRRETSFRVWRAHCQRPETCHIVPTVQSL